MRPLLLKTWTKILTLKILQIPHLLNRTVLHQMDIPVEVEVQVERKLAIKEKDLMQTEDQETSTTLLERFLEVLQTNRITIISTPTNKLFILWSKSIKPKCANISKILMNAHSNSSANLLMASRNLDNQMM